MATIKTFNDLPIEIQQRLNNERAELAKVRVNTAYNITLYSADGKRYFRAKRCAIPWYDTKTGNSMNFGGGTYWSIRYGAVSVEERLNPYIGEMEYNLSERKTFCARNDYQIPREVNTKAEVIEVIKKLGIFEI